MRANREKRGWNSGGTLKDKEDEGCCLLFSSNHWFYTCKFRTCTYITCILAAIYTLHSLLSRSSKHYFKFSDIISYHLATNPAFPPSQMASRTTMILVNIPDFRDYLLSPPPSESVTTGKSAPRKARQRSPVRSTLQGLPANKWTAN